jgi:tetratricopeptide (TPR) repeat protein
MERATVGALGADWDLSLVERGLIAGRSVCFYLAKLVWPWPLTFNYPRWSIDAGAAWQYAFPVAAVTAGIALWMLRHRLGRGPVVALLFFGGTLVPALGFFDVYPMRYSFVADHFQYLASLGPIALAAGAAAVAAHRFGPSGRRAGSAALLAVVAVLAVLTWRQAGVYHDRETLWRHTLEVNPQSWLAHSNLGEELRASNRLEESLVHFEAALAIQTELPGQTDLAQAYNNVGIVLVRLRRDDEALTRFRQALEALPGYPKAYHNIGIVLRKQGRLAEAREQFLAALRGWPDYANAHFNLANTLVLEGRIDEAIPHFEEALRLEPDRADVRDNLTTALEMQRRRDL